MKGRSADRGSESASSLRRLRDSSTKRRLVAVLFVDQLAAGAFYPVTTIYLTLVLEVPIATVGLLLTVSGLVGLLAGPFLGRLADALGAQKTVALANVTVGLGYAGLVYLFFLAS